MLDDEYRISHKSNFKQLQEILRKALKNPINYDLH